MPSSRTALLVPMFLCAALAGGPSGRCEESAMGAPGARTVLMATSYPSKENSPAVEGGSLVVINSYGKAITYEQKIGLSGTVTTIVEATISQKKLSGLFAKMQKIVDKEKYKGKSVAVKGGGKDAESTIALYGFKSEDIYLQRSGSKEDPGHAEIKKLIKGVGIEVKPQASSKQKVERGAWTMAGEGGSSSCSLDSGGYFEWALSGDIGSGYQIKQVTKKLLEAAVASAIFEKIGAVVKDKKLSGKASPGQSSVHPMSDSYYTLSGFSKSSITLHTGQDGYSEIEAIIKTITVQDPKQQPFFVSGIKYQATFKSPGPAAIEGEITVGGKWIQKEGNSESKGKTIKLNREKVASILSDVRKLVEKARASAGGAPAKSCAPPDEGITFIQVDSFAGFPGSFILNKNQFCEEFSAMKGILEDELSFADQMVKK